MRVSYKTDQLNKALPKDGLLAIRQLKASMLKQPFELISSEGLFKALLDYFQKLDETIGKQRNQRMVSNKPYVYTPEYFVMESSLQGLVDYLTNESKIFPINVATPIGEDASSVYFVIRKSHETLGLFEARCQKATTEIKNEEQLQKLQRIRDKKIQRIAQIHLKGNLEYEALKQKLREKESERRQAPFNLIDILQKIRMAELEYEARIDEELKLEETRKEKAITRKIKKVRDKEQMVEGKLAALKVEIQTLRFYNASKRKRLNEEINVLRAEARLLMTERLDLQTKKVRHTTNYMNKRFQAHIKSTKDPQVKELRQKYEQQQRLNENLDKEIHLIEAGLKQMEKDVLGPNGPALNSVLDNSPGMNL